MIFGMNARNRTVATVVAVVLAVVGGAVGAVVAVGMTQAAWAPFHAEQLEPLIAALEQERGDRTAELARLEEDRLAAVAAVSVDPATAASMAALRTQVMAMETARDAVDLPPLTETTFGVRLL